MLRTDLIELINRGGVWAFVGSGAAADAGCPSWKGLVEAVVASVDDALRPKILADSRYSKALSENRFPACFSRIEDIAGRDTLEALVARQLNTFQQPGAVLRSLADWPMAGYITTNYDGLLETALRERGELGWLSVGNSSQEVRKVSGDATRIVWHVHGSVGQRKEDSRLVLSQKDYDDTYLEGSSVVTQLKSLLSQRRIVFIGFGFSDPEVLRLLRIVGRFCDPGRPAFAFLSGIYGTEHEAERLELLEQYNIDVVPYRVKDGSHEELRQLLDVYSALILRRSLRFGRPERPCPSYDPETSGLLIYNQLVLRKPAPYAGDVVGSLLRARVMALLKERGPMPIDAIATTLSERIRLILAQYQRTAAGATREAIVECLDELRQDGQIAVSEALDVSLTEKGLDLVAEQRATAERLSGQFSACLADRARGLIPDDARAQATVARAAESFLKACIERRALGVALSLESPTADFRRYHIVALLQGLPEYLAQLATPDEARALVRLVEDVLARPADIETRYLGLALQAQFSIHLLGHDPDTIRARSRELAQTLFVMDSSTLIPLLGRSSVGHDAARVLLGHLRRLGCPIGTTVLLATEVAEHARWALEHVRDSEGKGLTPRTLAVATGRAGSRSNAFLEGFLEEVTQRGAPVDFNVYLDSVCGHPAGHKGTDAAFVIAIEKAGVACRKFDEWEGFSDDLWSERDRIQENIAAWRQERGTYRHERQVKAEAEALIIS